MSSAPLAQGEFCYRIAPHLVLGVQDDHLAFLLSETVRIPVVGADQVALFRCLERGATTDDLQLAAGPRLPEWLFRLQRHIDSGYVVAVALHEREQSAAEHDPELTWSAALDLPRPSSGLSLHSLGFDERRITERFATAALAHGVAITDDAPIELLLVRDYLAPDVIEGVTARLTTSTKHLVPCKPVGTRIWLGPVLGAGASCWDCLTHRLRENSPVETSIYRASGNLAGPRTPPHTPSSLETAARFAVTRLLRSGILDANGGELPLCTLDFTQFVTRDHAIPRRPQCPTCGDPTLMTRRAHAQPRLVPTPKTFTSDGGHRIMPPDETIRRLRKHVDPLTGLLSNSGPIRHRSDALRHVFGATHFVTPAPGDPAETTRFEMMSVGKGKTRAQAEASALCEALERKCARYQGDEAKQLARFVDVADRAVSPNELLLFSDSQFSRARNAKHAHVASPRSQRVPLRFDPERATWWTPAWSLSHQRQRLVPLAFAFAGTPYAAPGRDCDWDSNGCAAGNCFEEALLQGLFELIERDAAAVYWYNRICRPATALDAYGDDYGLRVRELYASYGYDVWALDITHDLEVPTYFAMARERGGSRFAAGLGCHLDPKLALQRALSELHQVFDPLVTAPPLWDLTAVVQPAYLYPNEERSVVHENLASKDLATDITLLVERLRRAGLETLVVDYTRPDADLYTVKAIVPGLRHFWPRFAPGRLYDVPVRLGWRQSRATESQLNPLALEM